MPKTINFINSNSKDGRFSARISKDNALRLKNYAKSINKSCNVVVNQAVKAFLDEQERVLYEQMDKDALIDLLMRKGF